MKKIILLVFVITSAITSNAQTPTWMWAQCGGGGNYCGGVGVAVSQSGHLYLGARFAQNCTFGGVTANGPGANNVLHGRFDTSGLAACKWLSPDNFSSGEDYCYSFAMDNRENTYLTGTVNSAYGGLYVDKYDSSGNKVWAYNPAPDGGQATQMPSGYAVAVDNSNDSDNVFVVGEYTNSITFGTTTLTAVSGSDDIFLVKLDSNGTPIWAVSAGGPGTDGGRGIAIDPTGNIYICGAYNGTATFGPFTTPPSTGSYSSLFVAKYDRSGNVQWVNTATNSGFLSPEWFWRFQAVAVDSCGDAYVTGTFYTTAQFGTKSITDLSGGNGNVFVAKLQANGSWEWVKSDGGTGGDGAISITLDKYSDVYVSGAIGSTTAKFDSITVTNPNAPNSDVFVAKYANSTGDAEWVLTQDGGSGATGSQGLVVDDHGYIYVSGSVSGNAILGPSSITSSANGNVMLAKIDTVTRRQIIPTILASYCPGSVDTIPYTVIGTFNSSNVFTVQLSDSTGSFSTDTAIGSLTSTTSGKIVVTIPTNIPNGSSYLIRVVSSNPSASSYANGCGAYYQSVYPNDFYVTIGGGKANVTLTPVNPTICSGSSITLKALGNSTYLWSTGATTDSIVVSPTKDSTYTVVIGSGSCSLDTSISVTVYQAPPVTITPPNASICSGQKITLTADTTGNSYTWSPANNLSSTTGDSVVANPTADITYTVTGIDSLGCPVTGNESVTVGTGPNKPIITLSVTGDTLFANAKSGIQWYVNGQTIKGATDSIYVITGIPKGDTVTVEVTDVANGCSTISDPFIATGINQLVINSNQLSIYPNPTNGIINVNISSSVMEVASWNLQLTDVLGRTVYTRSSLNYNNEIDLSGLPGGVYFISVINKTARVTLPVVKQN